MTDETKKTVALILAGTVAFVAIAGACIPDVREYAVTMVKTILPAMLQFFN